MEMAIRYIENRWVQLSGFLLLLLLIHQINYQQNNSNFTICIFRNITGQACYGCGWLRGVSACLHFDFGKAWQLNLLNVVTIPLIGYISTRYFFQLFRKASTKNKYLACK
ncbi:MAG: DUF2752 domain-containing protein [Sediminibacterium sp.]|nr:DUF2752 domain-containing protein [Sediminibacterium sp.]